MHLAYLDSNKSTGFDSSWKRWHSNGMQCTIFDHHSRRTRALDIKLNIL